MMTIGLVLLLVTGLLWFLFDLERGPILATVPVAVLNVIGWLLVVASVIAYSWKVMP